MFTLEQLLTSLNSKVADMHAKTQEWVEINSYSKNIEGVNACGAALARAFEVSGLSARVEGGGPTSGDHWFWFTPAALVQPPVMLVGHHDTVFPAGYFEGYSAGDGRGYGPGCLDMKGGLSVIWGVVATLAEAGLLAEVPLVVASVADEEVGSLSSAPYLEAWAKRAACGLVFEAGRAEDRIVTRRRGVGMLRVVATGRAAHAGNAHQEGANAIWSLARFIDLAQGRTDYARGLTVNTGVARGGTSTNTVPLNAEATVDLRFESVLDANELMSTLGEYAKRAALPGTRLELEGGIKRLPMEKTPAADLLLREYAECQRLAGLGSEEHPLVGGGSDANTMSGVGLPCIDGLGPRGSGFHTRDEYVELDSFGPKAEALLRFLHRRLPKG